MKNQNAGANFRKRWMSLAMALLLMAVMLTTAVPAYAANVAPTENLNTTFDKYLVMEEDANVPNATFNFTIKPGAAVPNTAIVAGIGAPTVEAAVFAPTDTAYDAPQTGDSVKLTEGEKYAVQVVTVDFSDVSFTAPGIYRYTITESPSSISGITNDASTTRTLDVYVGYEDNSDETLKVMSYVLQDGTAANPTTKSEGFTNRYATSNLTLTKLVTGNQGNRFEAFNFTVTISNTTAGTKYTVQVGESTETLTVNPGETSVTGTYELKHNESVVIKGLAPGNQFTITETDYSTKGYSTSYTLNGGDKQENLTVPVTSMGADDQNVVFTNHREGTVPTGILLDVTPYLILGAVVILGFVALFVFKRRRTH